MNPVVKVEGLRKTYGKTIAVDGISFEVQEGEIFGMVGPNGAGKTTTIECLEGLRKPESGKVNVLGVDPITQSHYIHLHTGMQLQQSNLPDRMKVWEALDLYHSFYPKAVNWEELLVQLGLAEKRNTQFNKLSGGQKQRLFIALALLPNPQLVFLDELTTGLDPQARHAIWDLIQRVHTEGKTVLLTTHFMEEAERLCDRVAILDNGRIAALDTPEQLILKYGGGARLKFSVDCALSTEFATAVKQFAQIEVDGDTVIVRGGTNQSSLVSDVVLLLVRHEIRFSNLLSEQSSLEDVFLKLTGRQMKD